LVEHEGILVHHSDPALFLATLFAIPGRTFFQNAARLTGLIEMCPYNLAMSDRHVLQLAPQETRTDVLLIDDSITDLQLLMEMMTLRDLRISVALDGSRGYQQAVLLRPGLVLLDVHMPDMDGFTTCRRLKANPLTRDIPVIFLTGANELRERLEGFAVGGVDYICKPFEDLEVLARVGVHLHRANLTPELAISPLTVEEATDESSQDAALFTAAQKVLRDTVANPPGLERLARLLGTNRRRLNEVFQVLSGQPVFGWLREERLRLAYALVSQSNTPFSQISEKLGYSTHSSFTKAFRLRYGFTPSKLRHQLTGQWQADDS
jgi:DNA-binding response OmpR family regulator